MANHFIGDERAQYEYLMVLYHIVSSSTVCLMGHERKQTLRLIDFLGKQHRGEVSYMPMVVYSDKTASYPFVPASGYMVPVSTRSQTLSTYAYNSLVPCF